MITVINNDGAEGGMRISANVGRALRGGAQATARAGEDMQETAKRQTKQKCEIERVVLSSCDHPTAETVCERVREALPAVSLGTVYRVLKGLVEEGRVREISVPCAPARFDKTTGTHAHFVCEKCGRVEDVGVDASEIVRAACRGCGEAEITEAEIIFRGVCCKCKEENQ